MTNEKKKIKELVSLDEAAAEMDARTTRQSEREASAKTSLEADEDTYDMSESESDTAANGTVSLLRRELKDRSGTVERLQFDFEQVRAKWQGLQTELRSREELCGRLQGDLRKLTQQLAEAESTLQERDASIGKLKSRLQEQATVVENLEQLVDELRQAKENLESGDEITAARERLIEYEGAIAGLKAAFSGLRNQHQQTEAYADKLRRELSDLRSESQSAMNDRATLRVELRNAESTIASLEARLLKATRSADEAEATLQSAREAHEREIRQLRFELAEAAETITESSQMSEQLASDLVTHRGARLQLEERLSNTEQENRNRVGSLEQEIGRLQRTIADYEAQLENKTHTNQALMAELSRRAQGDEQHIDDDVILGATPADRHTGHERISRVLVARIDDKELRFPLFKDRLTIGRTQQNDIYLKAQFISRRHAVVVTENDRTRIIDWGSKNGVYVNGERVTEHYLQSGDRIAVGAVEFRYDELPRREPHA